MALFESYERRIPQINAVLNSYGISSIEEAEKLAKKKLHEKNLEEFAVSLTLMGNFALLASNTVQLVGFHKYDGKYLITKSEHEVGNGYTTKIDLRRVINEY